MAPEKLFRSNMEDQSADIWSLGCILAALALRKNQLFTSHKQEPFSYDHLMKQWQNVAGKEAVMEFL